MDMKGNPIPGIFYSQQLRKHIGPTNIGRVIEKVVHDDEPRQKVTVKFLGWDKMHNQTMSYQRFNQLVNRQNQAANAF